MCVRAGFVSVNVERILVFFCVTLLSVLETICGGVAFTRRHSQVRAAEEAVPVWVVVERMSLKIEKKVCARRLIR
jgi:hypothetical protein